MKNTNETKNKYIELKLLAEKLETYQHESGYFFTILKPSNIRVERIMTTSLTAKVLCYILLKYGWQEDIACIVEKSIKYIIESANKNQKWQWNYFPNHKKSPFPDDYDDTAISNEAILLWELAKLTHIQDSQCYFNENRNSELIESLRNKWRFTLVSQFSSLSFVKGELRSNTKGVTARKNPLVNGYPTWIIEGEDEINTKENIWLNNIDPVVNAHIANVCLLLGLNDYIPQTYLKNFFERFVNDLYVNNHDRKSSTNHLISEYKSNINLYSEFYISTLPYLHSLIFLSSHNINGKRLFNQDEILIIEKLFLEELSLSNKDTALYIESIKNVQINKVEKSHFMETEYATCPAYLESLITLYR